MATINKKLPASTPSLLEAVHRNCAYTFLTDIETGKSYTYQDLVIACENAQRILQVKGIVSGQRVAYITKNNPYFYPLFFACLNQGAVLVPVNIENHKLEIKTIIEDSDAQIIFYDEDCGCELENLVSGKKIFLIKSRNFSDLAINDNIELSDIPCPINKYSDEQEALIIYTSGTEGNSKGVILTQKNLYSMAYNLSSFYHFRLGQRFLCVLPLHHINAIMITGLACIMRGAQIILAEVFNAETAYSYWKIVEKHKIEVISITPSIMSLLLRIYPEGIKRKPPNLKYALVGTAYLNEGLWRSFEKKFGFPCYQGYGLTETTTWATMTPKGRSKRYDTVGIPFGCKIRINKTTISRDKDSASCQGGEILIKGDIVMKGYNKRDDLTFKYLQDGWLKTGDLGCLGPDGQLIILGRVKNIIKRKGITIFPEEIDKVLIEHENILDCCTVGIENELLGEEVVSVYVARDKKGDMDKKLREHVSMHLSSYKWPDRFISIHAIPKNRMGKNRVGELRDIISGNKSRSATSVFNTQKIKRANTPDLENIHQLIQSHLLDGTNFYFIGYWGVGTKSSVNHADLSALDRLKNIVDSVNAILGENRVKAKLILADIHGYCNNIPVETIKKYFAQIKEECDKRHFEYELLGSIWKEYGLDYDAVIHSIEESRFTREWNRFILKEDLIRQANRRSMHNCLPAETAAKQYYAITKAEKSILAQRFKGNIFFTYSSLNLKFLLPDLPTVYWFSIKKGISERPWFITG